jgi:hypothetical protein
MALGAAIPLYRYYVPLVAQQQLAKKGLGGGGPAALKMGASWNYQWGTNGEQSPWVQFVPMIWGAWEGSVPQVAQSDWLMGFNEPDMPRQSNLTPERAARLWHEVRLTYPERSAVCPAPSQLHPEWIEQFWTFYVKLYDRLPCEALAVHGYYPAASDLIVLVQYYVGLAQGWGVPEVWVTEWAIPVCLTGSMEVALTESQKVADWLEAEPMVTRYAWFIDYQDPDAWWYPSNAACDTSLLTKGGQMTEYGQWYEQASR